MNSFVIAVVLMLSSATFALPQPDLVENGAGELFHLIPLNRVRRADIYGNLDITDPGRAIVGVKGMPVDNVNHRLNTNVFATDNIRHHSPLTVGGEANYLHKPTGSTANFAATHTEKWGTDMKAAGRYNFFQDKTSNANIEAFASKHVGGFIGNQPLDRGFQFNYRKVF